MRGKPYQEGWLTAEWSARESDIVYNYPRRPDGHLLHNALSHFPTIDRPFLEELKRRGYDIKTLKFSIRLKPQENA